MSEHTPRCGCYLTVEFSGTGFEMQRIERIVFCPLHEAARDLLAALERSAEAAHALTGDPTCERHHLRECPTSYCASARAAIDKATRVGG